MMDFNELAFYATQDTFIHKSIVYTPSHTNDTPININAKMWVFKLHTNFASAAAFSFHPYLLTYVTTPLAHVRWLVLSFMFHSSQYCKNVVHCFLSTPKMHNVCPFFPYLFLRRALSDFMNHFT